MSFSNLGNYYIVMVFTSFEANISQCKEPKFKRIFDISKSEGSSVSIINFVVLYERNS